jgi:O-antigen ligase
MEHSSGNRRARQIGAIFVFLMLLIGAKNASGLATAFALVILIGALFWSRARQSGRLALFGALAASLAVYAGSVLDVSEDGIFGILGRDATLSGRTDLWQLVMDAIGDRPMLGYGYSAFWGADGPAANLVYPVIGWTPAAAHNGFLEVAINLGIAGEVLLIFLLAIGLRRAAVFFWRGRDWLSAWPLVTMLYMILSNISNATFLSFGSRGAIPLQSGSLRTVRRIFRTQKYGRDGHGSQPAERAFLRTWLGDRP